MTEVIAPVSLNLNAEFRDFIDKNAKTDIQALRLAMARRDVGFPVELALVQIEARRKTMRKLPRFLTTPETLFPDVAAAEMATDEAVATYHASIVNGTSTIADVTAGLGIDALTLAKKDAGCRVTAVEIDRYRAEILAHNALASGAQNLTVVNADCLKWLPEQNGFDIIFIDPARRDAFGKRAYGFADCQPDIVANAKMLLSKCSRLLIKASPLLDITQCQREVEGLRSIRVVEHGGECKELLLEASQGAEFKKLEAIVIGADGKFETYGFPVCTYSGKATVTTTAPREGMMIVQPGAALMKLARWADYQSIWPQLEKVGSNTHLFVTDKPLDNFAGRQYIIKELPDKKRLKEMKGEKINTVSRNHPLTAQQIKQKYGLRDGGDDFLIACRWGNREIPTLLRCALYTP